MAPGEAQRQTRSSWSWNKNFCLLECFHSLIRHSATQTGLKTETLLAQVCEPNHDKFARRIAFSSSLFFFFFFAQRLHRLSVVTALPEISPPLCKQSRVRVHVLDDIGGLFGRTAGCKVVCRSLKAGREPLENMSDLLQHSGHGEKKKIPPDKSGYPTRLSSQILCQKKK